MTRETKVGLVVSASFLCLVGIVLVSKLNEPGIDVQTQESSTFADADPTPADKDDTEQSSGSVHALEVSAADKPAEQRSNGQMQPGMFKGGDGASPVPPSPRGDAVKPAVAVRADNKKEDAEGAVGDQSLTQDPEKEKSSAGQNSVSTPPRITNENQNLSAGPAPSLLTKTSETPSVKSETVKVDPLKSTAPPVPRFSGSTESSATNPQPEMPDLNLAKAVPPGSKEPTQVGKTTEEPKGQSSASPAENSRDIRPPPSPPPAAPDTSPPIGPLGKDKKQETRPGAGSSNGLSDTGTKNPPALTGGLTTTTAPASGTARVKSIVAAPESENKVDGLKPAAPPGSPAVSVGAPGGVATDNVPVLGGPTPGRDNGPGAPRVGTPSASPDASERNLQSGPRVGTLTPQALPSNPLAEAPSSPAKSLTSGDNSPNRAMPTLGAPVPALNSAIAVPMPRTAAPSPAANNPLVESYDEDTHVCRANETLRTISQTYYQSDRYERALLLFNRNHPLATESIRQDPPQLAPGQKVYVPPARILEKYYASALAEAMPVQPEATPSPRNLEPSVAVRPTNAAPIATAAPSRAAVPVAEKTYRVAANGEMMREIARRTLGDADRWAEIYQLNLQYDPKEPVPAGTELRLPSNARPDAAATP